MTDEADQEDVERALRVAEETEVAETAIDTVHIRLENAPDQLGIFASEDASERWITASGDSFVDLEEMS